MANNPQSAEQQRALDKIVKLAQTHALSADAVQQAILTSSQKEEPTPSQSNLLVTILAYLGGSLILSGLLIYCAIIWSDLGSFPRVVLSLGSGLLAYVVGLLLQKDTSTQKASMPLWIVSALFIPTGLFVFLHEYADGGDRLLGGLIVFAVCFLIYAFGFLQCKRTSLLFYALSFAMAAIGTFYEYIHINIPEMWLVTGISAFVIGTHVRRSSHAAISFLPLLAAAFMITSSTYYVLGNTDLESVVTSVFLALVFAGYIYNSRALITFSTIVFISLYGKHYGYSWGFPDDEFFAYVSIFTGISMVLAAEWIRYNSASRLVPLWYFFGSGLIFSASMALLYETPLDIIFPALPTAFLILSMRLKSRALLLSAIFALLSFIGYYTSTYFADTLGWPIALMISGLALILLCVFALRVNNRIKKSGHGASV